MALRVVWEYTAWATNDIQKAGRVSWILFMASAVYSHITQNKAIQYYYYNMIWSWLCSEILTILMYTVNLEALQQRLPKSSGST